MKIYYAHSLHLYGKPQEKRDIELLESLGFEVYNPNQPEVQENLEIFREKNGDDRVMNYFNSLLDACDAIAFRAHADGKISSGVAHEVIYMKNKNKPVIELPNLLNSRYLEVGETRQYLELLGQR